MSQHPAQHAVHRRRIIVEATVARRLRGAAAGRVVGPREHDLSERVGVRRIDAEQTLQAAHAELECRVAERTAELEALNARLEASLREKEILLKEIHHRVKNNLQIIASLLSLQQDLTADPQAVALIEQSARRIGSIALVHEMLYQRGDLAAFDLAAYIRTLSAQLMHAYGVEAHAVYAAYLELFDAADFDGAAFGDVLEDGFLRIETGALLIEVRDARVRADGEPSCWEIEVAATVGSGLFVDRRGDAIEERFVSIALRYGAVTFETKSGTNLWSGEAFEYFRDKALNTMDRFEKERHERSGTPKPDFRRNQFGAALGGPIVRDRLHFFTTAERTKTDSFATVTTGRPEFYSALEGTFPIPEYSNMVFARGDVQINQNQTAFGRYAWQDSDFTCEGCGGRFAIFSVNGIQQKRYSWVGGHTWVLSSRVVNELRGQATNVHFRQHPPGVRPAENLFDNSPSRTAPLTQVYVFPSLTWGTNGNYYTTQYAREHGVPCFGTCGGMQHIVLEYARNVLGFRDAQHAEYDPYASELFISALTCSLAGREMQLRLVAGSQVAKIYGGTTAVEQYYCNFGVHPDRVAVLASGGGTNSRRSKRPGRRNAASRCHGAFVAARIRMPSFDCSSPSISARNWLMRCRPPACRMSLRLAPRASTSSKNSTQGLLARARSNTSCRLRSLWPIHISRISLMPTARKPAFTSPAVARARWVFPHPGGPYIRMPPPMALP